MIYYVPVTSQGVLHTLLIYFLKQPIWVAIILIVKMRKQVVNAVQEVTGLGKQQSKGLQTSDLTFNSFQESRSQGV